MVHGQGINHILSCTYGGRGLDSGEIAVQQSNRQSRMTRTGKSNFTGDLLSQGDLRVTAREQCIVPCGSKLPRDNGHVFHESVEQIIHTCEMDELCTEPDVKKVRPKPERVLPEAEVIFQGKDV